MYYYAPSLLRAKDAAFYLSISVNTLRSLPIPRRLQGKMRFYDRRDLDAYADSLPYENNPDAEIDTSCDEAFL